MGMRAKGLIGDTELDQMGRSATKDILGFLNNSALHAATTDRAGHGPIRSHRHAGTDCAR